MIISYFYVVLLVFTGLVHGGQVEVLSLYDQKSKIPGVLIPLKIQGDLMQEGILTKPQILTPANGDCRIMQDPYIKNILLVKCLVEATVMVKFTIIIMEKNQLYSYEVRYGPFDVKQLLLDEADPIPPEPPPDMTLRLRGRQVYGSYCFNCHHPAKEKAGRTARQIEEAVKKQSSMKFLATQIKAIDYEALAAYLSSGDL